jgi:hypothetical protein
MFNTSVSTVKKTCLHYSHLLVSGVRGNVATVYTDNHTISINAKLLIIETVVNIDFKKLIIISPFLF